ncbi:MAG: hypothetical protein GC190_21895 [Alphaproteobacteria bacterium]|nr:hypothetical protein [Alphaproteobacteria bacterium]
MAAKITLKLGTEYLMHWREAFEPKHLEEIGPVGKALPEWHVPNVPHVVAVNWGDPASKKVQQRADGKCLILAAEKGVTQLQVKITNMAGQVHADSADIEVTD